MFLVMCAFSILIVRAHVFRLHPTAILQIPPSSSPSASAHHDASVHPPSTTLSLPPQQIPTQGLEAFPTTSHPDPSPPPRLPSLPLSNHMPSQTMPPPGKTSFASPVQLYALSAPRSPLPSRTKYREVQARAPTRTTYASIHTIPRTHPQNIFLQATPNKILSPKVSLLVSSLFARKLPPPLRSSSIRTRQ